MLLLPLPPLMKRMAAPCPRRRALSDRLRQRLIAVKIIIVDAVHELRQVDEGMYLGCIYLSIYLSSARHV